MPLANGQITILDLNDAIKSGTPPLNPSIGTLWIDESETPNALKSWNGTGWVEQQLAISALDPGFHEEVQDIKDFVTRASSDGYITSSEKFNMRVLLAQITGDALATTTLPTLATMDTAKGGEVYLSRAEAVAAGILTSNIAYTEYETSYNDLKAYLETLNPRVWIVGDTPVVNTTWMSKWDIYYEKLSRLKVATSTALADRVKPGVAYNGVTITTASGVVVLKSDNLVRTTLNATEGITVERNISGTWTKVFFTDTLGKINANGLIIDATSTVGGKTASELAATATNFNNRNDRKSTTPASPIIAADGTAVDHVINTDSSADISFEWAFTGTGDAYDIDGFIVYVYASTSNTSYTFATDKPYEQVFTTAYDNRSIVVQGAAANKYYTFGIQAYRRVDKDINATGILRSAIVKPTLAAENPYQPSTSVAFAGNITGTVNGTAASTVVTYATAGNTANTTVINNKAVWDKGGTSIQQATAYNGVKIDSADGVVVTKSDNTVKTTMNATEGIKLEKSTDNGATWTKSLYWDPSGVLTAEGLVAKSLTIDSGSTINGTAASTVVSNASNGNAANTSITTNKSTWDKGGTSVQQNTAYNGVKIDSTNGMVVQKSDNKVKTTINATDGIKIEKSTDAGATWAKTLYADTNGTLTAEGLIAKSLVIDAGSTINGTAASTVVSNANNGNTANTSITTNKSTWDKGGTSVQQNTAYNGVKIDSTNGMVVQKSDNKVKTTINATEGIKIEKSTDAGVTWAKTLYADTNGTLTAEGLIAKALTIDATSSINGTNAATVVTNANNSAQAITDMSSDGKVTPVEKNQLKKEWATIVAEKGPIDAMATTFGNVTEKANYGTSYTNLNNALNTAGTGILINMTTTSTIDATAFRATFDDYYDKKALLMKAINEASRTLANNAQGTANTANTAAGTAQSTANAASTAAANAQDLAYAMQQGKILHNDPLFKIGTNSCNLYNNAGGTNLTVTRIAKPADAPTVSTHALEIKAVGGTTSPGWGGYVQNITARANAKFVVKIIAKIPVGLTLNTASNSMGTGYSDVIISSNQGTGKYEEYMRVVKCGATGTFSGGGHFYLSGGATPTSGAPLIWYVAYATVFDITDSDYTLADMANDNKLSPVEKAQLKKEWATIAAEKPSIESTATTYGIVTNKNSFVSAYDTLNSYITPYLADMTVSSDIVGTTFRNNFDNYYDKKAVLKKEIDETSRSLANAAQAKANTSVQLSTAYNGVKIDTTNGLVVQRSDNEVKTTINATEGILIEKSTNGGSTWTKTLYADTNGTLTAEGLIAKSMVIDAGSTVNGTAASTVVTNASNGNTANTTVNSNKATWDKAGTSIQQATAYNGVKIDTTNGMVVQKSDNKVKTTINATEGIKIEKSTDAGVNWTKTFYVDTNGVLNAEGLNAKALTIDSTSSINGSNAATVVTNANNAATMIADMSSDGKITPVEKVQLKKEWAAISAERPSIDGMASTFGITTERTNMTTAYNNLDTTLNGASGVLLNMTTTSTVTAATFRATFDDYYDKKAILQRKISETARALANSSLAQGHLTLNPIFADWTSTYPTGFALWTTGTGFSKETALSKNGGYGARFKITTATTQIGMSISSTATISNQKDPDYLIVELDYMLVSGSIAGAGLLLDWSGYSPTRRHTVNLSAENPSPTLNKWYTVRKLIPKPTGTFTGTFTNMAGYVMANYSSGMGTLSIKDIVIDRFSLREPTEEEIKAYDSAIMIADMSSDGKITPVEKVQLKKEWAAISAERTSIDGMASTFGITTERTNMTTAYNNLNTALNGTGGVLLTMTTTSTVVAATFRATFDDYYDKKAILQRKISETARSLANSAQAKADTSVQQSTAYNGVKIDSTNGVVVQKSDNKVKTTLNATEGFKIEKSTDNGATWKKALYADTNGNLTAEGIVAKSLIIDMTNGGEFKAQNDVLGLETSFEIQDGLFSHAIGDSNSFFGFYDGDVDAIKGMYGNSSQGRIAFASGYMIRDVNGNMAFQPTVPSTLEAGGYWTDGGVETGYLWVKGTGDVSGTSTETGIMIGNPSGGNLKLDWNEISGFNSGGLPAELHVSPDGGRVVFNNNGIGGNLVIDQGYIVNQGRISPSLQNGWVNYGSAGGTYAIAGYWKDKNGVVHLAGLIKGGTAAVGTLILTLPVGYRPVGTYMFNVHSPLAASYNTPRLDLGADGRLTIQTAASSVWLSLAGISFKAED